MPAKDMDEMQTEKMPEEGLSRKEKIYKTKKQKIIEERKEFVTLSQPRQTVEVSSKPRPTIEEIEKVETKEESDKEDNAEIEKGREVEKASKKPGKKAKRTVIEKTKPVKIETLKGNSILIVTEKPQAAEKISYALSNGSASKHSEGGIPFYEFEKDGEHVIVACAVGHLFSLSQDVKGSSYPIFEVSWKPNFEVRKKDFTKKYYTLLGKLAKRAKEIIIATDYDIEGEVIGYNIVRFIAHQKDAERMKFSSLTKDELEEAFRNKSPTIDWGQAIAGETRHFIDWYYGINLSRALMSSIKAGGRFRIMSIGRVQGPALKMVVEKEREITSFKPRPYWKIFIQVKEKKDKTNKAYLRHTKDIFEEKQLPIFEKLKGKECDVSTEKHEQTLAPPYPFDLTTLQTEAYKFFGLNPARTLAIAQELYLAGLISYPRTSSQKIPDAINPKGILKKLSKNFQQVELATRQKPVEGKKSDPAHPSIYPTGEFQKLEAELSKVYELIVKRFISCFCEDALVENKTITAVTEEKLVFKERGLEVKKQGWMEVYQATLQEKELKDMNGRADIIKVNIIKDETKPPRRYSPASIISELEKKGLGTKATRANILETLYDRGYITDNRSIKATALGINLINTLEKYSPIIIDEKLTKNMEKDMEAISTSKKDLDKKEIAVLDKAKKALVVISEDFKQKEAQIGSELIKATDQAQRDESELILCPNCQKGKLTIKFSPKFKKSFIACNSYPDCKTTYSLPPGLIKKTDKICDKCNFPLLMRIQKGKRPWIFCFNPTCPTRLVEGVYVKAKKEEASGEKSEEPEKENQENPD